MITYPNCLKWQAIRISYPHYVHFEYYITLCSDILGVLYKGKVDNDSLNWTVRCKIRIFFALSLENI